MTVILKNLVDPQKSLDLKYRTLKLENAKLQQTLFCVNYIRAELLEGALGFVLQQQQDNTLVLPLTASTTTMLPRLLQASTAALEQLSSVSVSSEYQNKKPRVEEKLSEKQKARRLAEEKARLEKLAAKQERQRNLTLLKEDKAMRESDPTWKPGVSAACTKSGSSITTFRDRYGE